MDLINFTLSGLSSQFIMDPKPGTSKSDFYKHEPPNTKRYNLRKRKTSSEFSSEAFVSQVSGKQIFYAWNEDKIKNFCIETFWSFSVMLEYLNYLLELECGLNLRPFF